MHYQKILSNALMFMSRKREFSAYLYINLFYVENYFYTIGATSAPIQMFLKDTI